MNKNILLPIAIIAVALVVGGTLVFTGQNKNEASVTASYPDNTRILAVSIPDMVCAGCAASVEGYVKSMPGVLKASVALATKSGTFLYDPSKVTKEQIVKNTIFDIYAPVIVSDEKYDPSRDQIAQTGAESIPIAIQQKLHQVAQLLVEKKKLNKDVTSIQAKIEDVNELLRTSRNQEAESLLDTIIKELENL
jgi:copper chaperone CopZ